MKGEGIWDLEGLKERIGSLRRLFGFFVKDFCWSF